jgi:hypothetical protein
MVSILFVHIWISLDVISCFKNLYILFFFQLDQESNAGNVRLTLEKYDPFVNSFNLSALCSPSSPPTSEEFHVLVKKGKWIDNEYHILDEK